MHESFDKPEEPREGKEYKDSRFHDDDEDVPWTISCGGESSRRAAASQTANYRPADTIMRIDNPDATILRGETACVRIR